MLAKKHVKKSRACFASFRILFFFFFFSTPVRSLPTTSPSLPTRLLHARTHTLTHTFALHLRPVEGYSRYFPEDRGRAIVGDPPALSLAYPDRRVHSFSPLPSISLFSYLILFSLFLPRPSRTIAWALSIAVPFRGCSLVRWRASNDGPAIAPHVGASVLSLVPFPCYALSLPRSRRLRSLAAFLSRPRRTPSSSRPRKSLVLEPATCASIRPIFIEKDSKSKNRNCICLRHLDFLRRKNN
ncbi:hypothetical protein PUN28_015472 [Cardiocondyla obscurior]|uniref:Transmembrane protein n=1 Tax=Cardiocondyla obscurior TaxID=286306 RepID=A0AAW2EVK8_9HYME